jgi:hypothetical protein
MVIISGYNSYAAPLCAGVFLGDRSLSPCVARILLWLLLCSSARVQAFLVDKTPLQATATATAHRLQFNICARHSWEMALNVDLNHWYLFFSFKTRFRTFPRGNQETCVWNRQAPNWPATSSRNLPTYQRSRSHFTTDGRSVGQSVYQGIEPTLELVTRYHFLPEGCFLKVAALSSWGALSDERSGLSLVLSL